MRRQSAPAPSLAICVMFVASMLSSLDIFASEGHEARAIMRRKTLVDKLRGPSVPVHAARDFEQALATNHHSSKTGLGAHPSDSALFDSSSACVLQPEVTVGPYWVKGELVRSDITDGQAGVPMYVEYQIVDFNTCKPVPEVYLDIWHANATGVYSGVVAQSNGNSKDTANLKRTNNRGIQKTDASGVVAFKSIFPGHYVGRAPHVHLIATLDPTVTAEHTLAGGHIAHVGQTFFDTSLADEIYATAPYASDTQLVMQNKDDDIMQEESAGAGVDPVMRYIWLGNNPAEGLLAWIVVGVDTAAAYSPQAAGTLPVGDTGNADNSATGESQTGGLLGFAGIL